MADLTTWVAGARPRTLPAAIVPVLVGTACAAGVPPLAGDGPLRGISLWRFGAAMIVALAIQVGTNYANDYSDGKRGTDDPGTRAGPPRLVGHGLASPKQVKIAAIAAFGVAAVAGLALAAAVNWWLIALGAVCFAAGWLYTGGPRPYGYAGFGEVFVFVFFGLVATLGSAYVQTGHLTGAYDPPFPCPPRPGSLCRPSLDAGDPWSAAYPLVVAVAGAAVGALATALLVVNNLRDIPSDSLAGKRTLAVQIGDRGTRRLYVGLVAAAFALAAALAVGRPWAALALVAAPLALPPLRAVRSGATGRELIPVLAQTGRLQLVYGVLLALGLVLAS